MKLRIRRTLHKARDFFRVWIWDQDLADRPWVEVFGIRQIRVAIIVIKGCTQGGLALRASAMTFTTLLTLVPLLAITFSIIHAFGGFEGLETNLQDFVYENLMPGVQTQFRGWLDGFFGSVRSGAFNGLTLLFLSGGVLGLLTSIEASFNDIWGVHRGRSLFSRVSTFTTLIVFSPILIGLSLSMTASLQSSVVLEQLLLRAPVLSAFVTIGFKLVPVLLTGVAFTLLYTILPNVKVRIRAALPAGMVAAILWEISKIGYTAYLKGATHYATIYGSLSAFPLFLLWIYLTWLVVLFGAHLTFAQEAADDFREEEMSSRVSQTERIRVALSLALEAARNYKSGITPPELVGISRRLGLPLRLVRDVAAILTRGGILNMVVQHRSEDGIVPGRTPDQISVYQIIRCLLDRGHVPIRQKVRATRTDGAINEVMADLDTGLQGDWKSVSLEDLLSRKSNSSRQDKDVLPFPGSGGKTAE